MCCVCVVCLFPSLLSFRSVGRPKCVDWLSSLFSLFASSKREWESQKRRRFDSPTQSGARVKVTTTRRTKHFNHEYDTYNQKEQHSRGEKRVEGEHNGQQRINTCWADGRCCCLGMAKWKELFSFATWLAHLLILNLLSYSRLMPLRFCFLCCLFLSIPSYSWCFCHFLSVAKTTIRFDAGRKRTQFDSMLVDSIRVKPTDTHYHTHAQITIHIAA